MWVTDWSEQAACRTTDPDELFTLPLAEARSKAICTGCPVRTECLADALDNKVEFGVWGGMTERERRALLQRRPDVNSWRRLLEVARQQYELSLSEQEERSYESLFRNEFSKLVGFLISAGARLVDAQDAAQMAFIELVRRWHHVDAPVPWLRSVAHRMWVKLIRKDHKHALSADPDLGDTSTTGDLEMSDQAAQVLDLLNQLPPHQRTAMAWAYDGHTPSETATALGVSPESVRQNLHRAKKTLACLIVEKGIIPCPQTT